MTEPREPASHVVVIGGGISGLTAAWALCKPELARAPEARIVTKVTLIESAPRLGGKIQTNEFAGAMVDTGPDAFLARVPWALHLCTELGIDDQLVSPARSSSYVWTRNVLRRFPRRHLLGMPASLVDLARTRILSPLGLMRVAIDRVLPGFVGRSADDVAVADLVAPRMGNEFLDRVIDPLVGGINAGNTRNLSLNSSAPQLADVATRRSSLLGSVADYMRRRPTEEAGKAVFLAPPGGMSTLVETLTEKLTEAGVTIATSTRAKSISDGRERQWNIELANGKELEADAVLIATPAHVTDDLLIDICPEATDILRDIEHSSVGLVRLAYKTTDVQNPLNGTGFVVPRIDGHLMTACSWASSKWSHLKRPNKVIFRASVGRIDDERFADMSDEEIIDAVHEELARAVGITGTPLEADVTRWEDAFPQFYPGHETQILELERATARLPGIHLAGAAYHGVGIPSCVRTARDSAEALLAELSTRTYEHSGQ